MASPSLSKWTEELPRPAVIAPVEEDNGVPVYRIPMVEFEHIFHSDLPPVLVWGYTGIYPGPTIEATRGEPIKVQWGNDLPTGHILPIDHTVHGAGEEIPDVRTVVHLHGGEVTHENDGYPEAWFTPGEEVTYYYPNGQRAATLWYHDHTLGITRLNVYAGLAGYYILRDECENSLPLPSGDYEIPILIQDKSFIQEGENASLDYPTQPDEVQPGYLPLPDPSIVPEFFGDTIVVNGKVWPYLEVEPRKYRVRLLNGSNSRFYRMRLDSGQPFIQIGTDGGLLEHPVEVTELLMAPAERADVIIDFSGYEGETITITNDAPTPFKSPDDSNTLPPTDPTTEILQFVVKDEDVEDESEIPEDLCPVENLLEEDAVNERNMTLNEDIDQYGRLILKLNNLLWDDPIIHKPILDTIEVWNLYNVTEDTHPIHLHLVQFQILERIPIVEVNGEFSLGTPIEIPEEEKGWKDTVKAYPGQVTRIIARFAPFTGIYPWHCHILEHEDHEMMRDFQVIRPITRGIGISELD